MYDRKYSLHPKPHPLKYSLQKQHKSLPKLDILTQPNPKRCSKNRKLTLQPQSHNRNQNCGSQHFKKNCSNFKSNKFMQLLQKRKKCYVKGSKIITNSKKDMYKINQLRKISEFYLSNDNGPLFSKKNLQKVDEQIIIIKKKVKIQKQLKLNMKTQIAQPKLSQYKSLNLYQNKIMKDHQLDLQNIGTTSKQILESKYNFLSKRHRNMLQKQIKIFPQSFSFKNRKEPTCEPWEVENQNIMCYSVPQFEEF